MTSIKKEACASSIALMTGLPCEVKLVPSQNRGIRFHYNGEFVSADVENVVSTEHCTVLGNERVKIMLVEHFMAACAICGIDSLDVYLSHFELPILDGGAKQWVSVFEEAGLELRNDKKYTIKEPLYYLNGKTHVVMLPSEKLNITYAVNFNHPILNHRWVNINDDFSEVVEARTFGYLKDLEMLQQAGYAKGVSVDNTVGLTTDGFTTNLKSDMEPVKHKVLDLLGDLYLTGVNPLNINAEIIVKEAGHAVHVKFAKDIKNKLIEEN